MLYFNAAFAIGLLFGLIGIGYYLGARKGIEAPVINFFITLCGTVYFVFKMSAACSVSITLAAAGAGTGAAFFITCLLIQRAIGLGCLSSMWIALNLNFIPTTLFCVFFYQEAVSFWQAAGLVTGALCILVLANQHKDAKSTVLSNRAFSKWKSMAAYFILLIGLLLFNSMLGIVMKALSYAQDGENGSLWEKGSGLFLVLCYGTSALLTGVYVLLKFPFRQWFPAALFPGMLAATGSVAGVTLLAWFVSHKVSGALFFPVSGLVTLLVGSIAPVLFFGERINRFWIGGNILALASVIVFIF